MNILKTVYDAIFIIYLFWVVFISALTDGFSLESEWQQVSRTLLSILADLNYAVDDLHSSFYFQFFQASYQAFGDRFKLTYYNWYHCHFHAPYFFQFSSKVLVLMSLSLSFSFTPWSVGTAKSTIR